MRNNILYKIYLTLLPILALIFAFISVVLLNMSLLSYSDAGINFGTILLWCEDTIIGFNNNVEAIAHVGFVIVLFIISLLALFVYFIFTIKNKKYIYLIHLSFIFFALFGGIASITYFFFGNYYMATDDVVRLIDVDYCLLILSIIGMVFALASLVFITIEIFKRSENKFEPVIIRKYK